MRTLCNGSKNDPRHIETLSHDISSPKHGAWRCSAFERQPTLVVWFCARGAQSSEDWRSDMSVRGESWLQKSSCVRVELTGRLAGRWLLRVSIGDTEEEHSWNFIPRRSNDDDIGASSVSSSTRTHHYSSSHCITGFELHQHEWRWTPKRILWQGRGFPTVVEEDSGILRWVMKESEMMLEWAAEQTTEISTGKQKCHVRYTAKQFRLGLFQDCDFAGDLEDSKSTSGGILCVFENHTFIPIVMWETLQNNADWHCFKTPILQEILKIRNPLQLEHCAYLEVTHLFQ